MHNVPSLYTNVYSVYEEYSQNALACQVTTTLSHVYVNLEYDRYENFHWQNSSITKVRVNSGTVYTKSRIQLWLRVTAHTGKHGLKVAKINTRSITCVAFGRIKA